MAVAGEAIIEILNRIKFPYNISMLARREVLGMMKKEYRMKAWIRSIAKERDRMKDGLSALTVVDRVFPTDANFFLVRFRDSAAVFEYLRQHKIIVRDRSGLHQCRNCLRLTIGKPAENKMLLRQLSNFVKENP